MNSRALVTLAAICFPLPCVLALSGYGSETVYGKLVLPAIFFGVPALTLYSAVRYGEQKGILSRAYLFKGAAAFGMFTGALIVIPLSYPMTLFREANVTALHSASQLIGILASLTALCLLYAYAYAQIAMRKR